MGLQTWTASCDVEHLLKLPEAVPTYNRLKMSATTPVVITVPKNDSSSNSKRIEKLFPKKHMLICGSAQLICAVLVAVCQIILLSYEPKQKYNYGTERHIGSGIWCGFFFGIAGIVGLIAAFRPSNCKLVAFMVMSIIASIFAIPLITTSGFGIDEDRMPYLGNQILVRSWRSCQNDKFTCGNGKCITASYQCDNDNDCGDNTDEMNCPYEYDYLGLCLWSIQALIGLIQAIIAITAAGYSCRVVCCGPKKAPRGFVIYNNSDHGGQFTVIPLDQLPTISTQQVNPPNYESATAEEPIQNSLGYQRF